MNIFQPTANGQHRQRGQGMTEFALALPIFLLLVLGVIEIGHLLYLYSSVYAGAREAARYGASVSDDPGMPRFADCDGIRNQARKIAFLSNLEDDQIVIEFDNPDYKTDPDYAGTQTCDDIAADLSLVGLGKNQYNRIIVSVKANYRPLIPMIQFPVMPIQTSIGRTIIRNMYFRDYLDQQTIPETTVTPPTDPPHCPEIAGRTIDHDTNTVEYRIHNNNAGSEIQIIKEIVFFWVKTKKNDTAYRLFQVDLTPVALPTEVATPIPTPDGATPQPHLWYSDAEDLTPMTELPFEYRINSPWYDQWPSGLEDYTRTILPGTEDNIIKIYFSKEFDLHPGISVEINFITPDGDDSCFGIDDFGVEDTP